MGLPRAILRFRAACAALAVAFAISTVIPGGTTLQCLMCSGDSPSNCTGGVQNCTSWQNVCIAKYYKLTKPGSEKSMFTLACGRLSECNSTYSMTVPNMREEQNVTCCRTDLCVPDTPSVPSTAAQPNGLLCKACHSKFSPSCRNPEVMECSGMENKCLNLVVKVSSGFQTNRSEISGCASESYCRNSPVSKSGGVTVRIEVNCTGPGAGNDTTTSPTAGVTSMPSITADTDEDPTATQDNDYTAKPSITADTDEEPTATPDDDYTAISDSMQTNTFTSFSPRTGTNYSTGVISSSSMHSSLSPSIRTVSMASPQTANSSGIYSSVGELCFGYGLAFQALVGLLLLMWFS